MLLVSTSIHYAKSCIVCKHVWFTQSKLQIELFEDYWSHSKQFLGNQNCKERNENVIYLPINPQNSFQFEKLSHITTLQTVTQELIHL